MKEEGIPSSKNVGEKWWEMHLSITPNQYNI
jgi:hypothetical protein